MTKFVEILAREPAEIVVWWATEIECASAIARLERSQALKLSEANAALAILESLMKAWHTIDPAVSARAAARRFLRVHRLRAADSLQLAAAWIASEGKPDTLEMVCLDDRLVEAAHREGFRVVDRGRLEARSGEL